MLIMPMDDESGHLNVNGDNAGKAGEPPLISVEDGQIENRPESFAKIAAPSLQQEEDEADSCDDDDSSSSSEEELEPLVPGDDFSDDESESDSDSDSESCSSNSNSNSESSASYSSVSNDDHPPPKRAPLDSNKFKFNWRKSIENTRPEEDEGPAYRWDEGSSRRSRSRDQATPIYRWNNHPAVDAPAQQGGRQKHKLRRSLSMQPLKSQQRLNRSTSMRMPTRTKSIDLGDQNIPPKKRSSLPYKGISKGRPDYRWDKGGGSKGSDKRGKMPMRTKSDLTGYVDTDASLVVLGKVKICLASTVFYRVPKTTKEMKGDLYYTKSEIKEFRAANSRRKQEQSAARLRARMAKASGKTGGRFPADPPATTAAIASS